jgi:protein-tyrosine-phosphatase
MQMAIRNVLYICTGNVFRSPVASEMTKKLFGGLGIMVESAGILEYGGAPLPERIIAMARGYGIDLSEHRPRRVNTRLVEAADLILVFDGNQVGQLIAEYPQARNKTYAIKDYAGCHDGRDMEDLWNKPVEVFQRFINELKIYVERCVSRIRLQSSPAKNGIS